MDSRTRSPEDDAIPATAASSSWNPAARRIILGRSDELPGLLSPDIRKLIYSERMLDDLARYSYLASEPLRLLFREWHPIQKSGEFRCFIRNRTLAGISQYHYAGFDEGSYTNKPLAFAKIAGRAGTTEAALKTFIAAEIIPHLPVDDLVADLWLDHMGKITLIEINPYGLSDPCLFSYEELETAAACSDS